MPHRLYGHVDAAENYSVGRWCADAACGARRHLARRAFADPGRRHRALFQGADPGPVGGAADAAGHPRRGAGAVRRRGLGGACTPSSRAAIRRAPRGSSPATGCGSPARSKCWRRRAARSPTGTATACRRCSMPTDALKVFPRRRPRRTAPPDRRALRRDAGAGRAGRGAGAGRAQARSDAAGDEGARRALAAAASRRRDHARRGRRRRQGATPAATPSGRSPGSATRCRDGIWLGLRGGWEDRFGRRFRRNSLTPLRQPVYSRATKCRKTTGMRQFYCSSRAYRRKAHRLGGLTSHGSAVRGNRGFWAPF